MCEVTEEAKYAKAVGPMKCIPAAPPSTVKCDSPLIRDLPSNPGAVLPLRKCGSFPLRPARRPLCGDPRLYTGLQDVERQGARAQNGVVEAA